VFEALGIDPTAEAVYRALLTEPNVSVDALTASFDRREADVAAALTRLAELGLLFATEGSATGWQAIRPAAALAPLLESARLEVEERREALDAAQAAAGRLMAEFPSLDMRASSGQFRPLHTLEEVSKCLEEMSHACQCECLTMLPGAARPHDRRLDQAMFDRGVTGRILWQDPVRNSPATMEYGRWLNSNGARVRIAPTLPTRMVVMDREIALIPLTDPENPHEGAAVVTSPGMIKSLIALFDQTWAAATPIEEPPAVDGETGLTDAERDLLILLGRGLTDTAVGKKLGVSERTVSRMVSAVMTRLGATSRFEAGLEAARRGWL
jgi:DNA-binding CsgD family transcriptional regulator